VIAVDPSSPITGGALLGDRVRMQAHAGDPDVFIRSMASRGHAGGLAATTTAAIAVLDAAGFDLVLVETVGTGQGEVEIAASADVTVVLEAPEGGDEVQAIKAGLLEVADIVVVNKGDRPGAARTAAQLRAMLVAGRGAAEPVVAHHADLPPGTEAIGAAGDGHAGGAGATESVGRRRPDVLITTASTGAGVEDLLAAIDRRVALQHGDRSTAGRRARAEAQVWSIVLGRLRARLAAPDRVADADAILDAVARHELDPYAAADRLVGLAEGGGT
jgi:LAO/AO transport system kinase